MASGYYLYGIFPAPGPQTLDLEGLDAQPVQAQVMGEFVLLYSEAKQERYLASRRNLLAHERVLEKAMQAGYRTLLPLQFGLIIADWSTLQADLLSPQRDHLMALLHKLQGHREVGIKILWEESAELEMLMRENVSLAAERDRLEGRTLSMDEVVRIGQAIEQAMADRRRSIVMAFQAALNPLAVEIMENDALTDAMIYNAAYLIPWDVEETFGHRVEALDAKFEGRLRIRYNNFTAPFNFAQLPGD